ncbi:MAG: DnaB-like helicase N-terminal domain-containing protein, partial [Lachnospiraceae bacterium]|nr:DnaB-like helicase N-terminal domain-containing protein [Lachnospiraceae bacterium]
MDEALIKKVMPHSIDAEKSVIGSMLMDQEAITAASEILIKDDFYGKQYGILYDAMVQLYKAGKPVDLVTLQNKLKEMDVPPELSSVEFLRDILSQVFTSANIKHYANIVKQKAMARNLIRTTENIANTCYLEKAPLEDILTKAE